MAQIPNTTASKSGAQAIATDFYGIGGDASLIQSVQIRWDTALVAVITIWSCNKPDRLVPLNDAAANNNWTQQIPPSGYTAIYPVGSATAGTPLVLTIAGGTAGNAHMDIGNMGAARLRAQVVCSTGGFLEIWPCGKE